MNTKSLLAATITVLLSSVGAVSPVHAQCAGQQISYGCTVFVNGVTKTNSGICSGVLYDPTPNTASDVVKIVAPLGGCVGNLNPALNNGCVIEGALNADLNVILGSVRNDIICGGAENDIVLGGPGNDFLSSGVLGNTESEVNILVGQGGNDNLIGIANESDVLVGGNGFDTAQGIGSLAAETIDVCIEDEAISNCGIVVP